MSDPIELVEYGSKDVRLSESAARRIATVGRGALVVAHADEPGLYSLTAQNMVGTLVVDDLRILIRPKIRPENLFLLLEVGLPPKAWRQESFDYTTSTDLLPSIIAFFARTLANTLARGLLRSYRPEEAADRAARTNRCGVPVPPGGRPIAGGVPLLHTRHFRERYVTSQPRCPSSQSRGSRFSNRSPRPDASVRADDLDGLRTRLNAHYKLVRLASLVVEPTLVDQRGHRSGSLSI